MTTRKRIAVLLLTLAVLAFLTLACVDDWDGMDRSEWHRGPTATFESKVETWLPTPPPTPTPQG